MVTNSGPGWEQASIVKVSSPKPSPSVSQYQVIGWIQVPLSSVAEGLKLQACGSVHPFISSLSHTPSPSASFSESFGQISSSSQIASPSISL